MIPWPKNHQNSQFLTATIDPALQHKDGWAPAMQRPVEKCAPGGYSSLFIQMLLSLDLKFRNSGCVITKQLNFDKR